jgi:ferritin-like metal-binding protein YciE
MPKAANSDQLRAAFEKHTGETEGQVQRLQQVFKMIKQAPKGKTCPAILGLVEEGEEVMELRRWMRAFFQARRRSSITKYRATAH